MASNLSEDDEPLQLVEFIPTKDSGGCKTKIQLKTDTVDHIVQKIGDRPISVVCVSGPSRQGKSFLLGYMIRCLDKNNEDDENWMGWNDKEKPLRGFRSGSGILPETKGIWIWSKPFIVKNQDGNEVAVLLLDSQGIYDDSTSSQDMSAIMGLSLLTSSVMIFNFFNNLQEDVLAVLNTYTQYGSMALEQGGMTPFQKLTFLIRDWNIPHQFPYGAKGGKQFLEAKLKINDDQSEEAKHIRESIKKCFQELDCFLMPHIGENALEAENFLGSISELSPKFASELEKFITALFLTGGIPVKEVMGSPVSAAGLKSCLESYVKMYNSDEVPSVETMWKATSQICNSAVVEKSLKSFRSSMKRKMTDNDFFETEEVQSFKRQALGEFNQAKKFGDAHTISEFEEVLENQMEAELSELGKLNGDKRQKFVTEAITTASNTFRSELEGELGCHPDDDLTFYEDLKIMKSFYKVKSTVLADFKMKIKSEPQDKKTAHVKSLTENMQSILDSLKSRNKANRDNAEKEITSILEELSSHHHSELGVYLQENRFEEDYITIRNSHNAIKAATVEFYKERETPGNEKFQKIHLLKLETDMDSNFAHLRKEHQLQIEKAIENINATIQTFREQLESAMKRVEANGFNEEQLKEMYAKKLEGIHGLFEQEVQSFPKDSPIRKDAKLNLEKQLQRVEHKIFTGVTERRKRSLESWHNAQQHGLDYYKQNMKQITKSCEIFAQEDLEMEHQRVRKEAIQKYEDFEKIDVPPNVLELNDEFREKILDEWNQISDQNQTKRELAISKAENFVRQCEHEYNKILKKEIPRLLTIEELEKCHQTAKQGVLDQLQKNCPLKDPILLQQYEANLEQTIQGDYTELKTKKLEEIATATREVLEKAQEHYHDEMEKHYQNEVFMTPTLLERIHELVKECVVQKCETINTRFRRSDVEGSLDVLLNKYKDHNDMKLNSEDDEEGPAIGIDLGTTHCCVAVYYKGKVHIIPNQQQGGIETTPSYVSFNLDGTESFGAPAKRDAYKNAERTIYDAKRIIGRKMSDPELLEDMKWWPFEVKEDDGVPKIMFNYKAVYPEQISGKLLAHCREMAESFLKMKPGTIKKAVITVPAYFNDGQRQATVDAGKLAKLKVLTILNEPTAAAIAYSQERLNMKPRKILIYDLGGGTFDVAVLDMKPKCIEVLGVKGDTHLGGEDFDKKMMEYCVAEFKKKHMIDLFAGKDSDLKQTRDDARRRLRRLQTECEWAKKTLATSKTVDLTVEAIVDGIDLNITVARGTFEELNMIYFEKSIRLVEEALKDIRLRKEEIDDVVLVGGSSRIPKVQEMLEAFFGGKALNKSIHPDLAVAYGAAVQAARLNGEQAKGKIDFSKIQDVTPMSLGVEIVTRALSVILPKNTKVPSKRMVPHYTVRDYQTEILFKVYQGEDFKLARNNKLLGEFRLTEIPPKPKCEEPVDVWMEVTAMGILHVEAVCRSTQGKNSIIVQENKQRMSQEAINKILNEEAASAGTGVKEPMSMCMTITKPGDTPPNDVLEMIIEDSLSEVENLSKKVDEFQGPHFNSSYKELQSQFTDIKSGLDELDVTGRAEISKKKMDALDQIEKLEIELTKKVHLDGERCGQCEVMSDSDSDSD